MRRILGACALALVATLSVTAQENQDTPKKRPVYSGAGVLYTVPSVTVVYPAGPDEDRDRNRVSAERRAAYLRGRHETETLVVADVDFDEEHHDDNLLVLGWTNRLLAESGLVTIKEDGWGFLGVERELDRDLLFAWRSPFDPERRFIFWSRIDPELDRYLPLPFFGSDYVVFDKYYVEQYGRFDESETGWRPQRKPGVMIDNRERRVLPPPRTESSHYVLHDVAGLTVEEARAVLNAREAAWDAAVKALGSPEKPEKIKLYVYRDSERKEELSSVHDARHHMPRSGELHLTQAIASNPSAHEDSHLVARQLYGPGYLTVLVEGVAVWTEQQQGENELAVYASMLAGRGEIPSVADLLDEETMRVLTRNRAGFPYAGLFVSWLLETFGATAVEKVYGIYESDVAALAAALDAPVDELEGSFRGYVEAQAEAGATEAAFRAARDEGRHFAQLGDYERAVPALQRALEIRPDHLPTHYAIAGLQIDLEMLAEAQAHLRTVLDAPHEQRPESLTALAWLRLGEVLDGLGESDEAREAYEKVLGLPDHRESHDEARSALDAIR